ncbi:MAG: hypothetical protein A2452_02775 [Candidatus Firestonebacteria bacterium RIFOXYC2_FULL_39_67]|nr:MAG: hypothetical protein A2536_02190 [Candidatus Firestonebacteria bacterium RIFOXYD2_FULL_39_29]OGF55383.1 MAG: hypothetical protein A2452_02775 [Candidatus Firestonebacteria bacterium RIFOXYC2_FULL_39_67]
MFLLAAIGQCGLTSTGPVLLKENFGARAQGMGDAYVAEGKDAFGMQYNPALLAYVPGSTISALYMGGLADNYSGFIGYVHAPKYDSFFGKSKDLVFGASLSTLQGGSMEVFGIDGTTTVVNSESDFLLTVSAALNLNSPLSLGVTAKYFNSSLVGQYSGSALAADIGAIYDLGVILNDLFAGVALQNIGTNIRYVSAEELLPVYLRFGFGYKYVFEDKSTLASGFEIDRIFGERFCFSFGIEYQLQSVFVRAGYKAGYDLGGISIGLGYKYDSFQVDYGIGFSGEFNGSYGKISLSYALDTMEQNKPRKTKYTPNRILK